jgi:hypothetical protein
MPTEESYLKSEIDIDIAFHYETCKPIWIFKQNFRSNVMHLLVIDRLYSAFHNVIYHDRLIKVLLSTAMSLKAKSFCVSKKERYVIDKSIIHMLGLVLKLGCVSDGLYLALYLYDTVDIKQR